MRWEELPAVGDVPEVSAAAGGFAPCPLCCQELRSCTGRPQSAPPRLRAATLADRHRLLSAVAPPITPCTPQARSSHTIHVIGDTVYLLGGEHTPRVPLGSDVFTYSLSDKRWRKVEVGAAGCRPRACCDGAASRLL